MDDVHRPSGVHLVDHRRQRGGLARSRHPGHQHQPARPERDGVQDRWEVELRDRPHLGAHGTEGEGKRAALLEGIHAEPSHALESDREIHIAQLLELLLVARRHHLLGDSLEIGGGQRGMCDGDQVPMHAEHRWPTELEMQIGATLLLQGDEELAEIDAGWRVSHSGGHGRAPDRTRPGGHRRRRPRRSCPRPRIRSRS